MIASKHFGSVLRKGAFIHRGYSPYSGEFHEINISPPIEGTKAGSVGFHAFSDKQRICELVVSRNSGLRLFLPDATIDPATLIGYQIITPGRGYCFGAPVHATPEKVEEYKQYRQTISDNYFTLEHYADTNWPFTGIPRMCFFPTDGGYLEWFYIGQA